MNFNKDLEWFKENIANSMDNYEIEYRFFEQGDLGSLNQVEFNNESKGGNIDFWSSGWVGIHLVDYLIGDEIINILFEPTEKDKVYTSLNDLIKLL